MTGAAPIETPAATRRPAPSGRRRRSILAALAGCVIATAAVPATEAPAPAPDAQVRTGKERLGKKWTDEQRVDNCNVPPDKRGDTPRPDRCGADPSDH